MRGVLADYRAAPIDERLRTMLAYLEKVTLRPAEVGPDDATALRAAGVSRKAAEEALYVCFAFNVMDRLADAFDFTPSTPAQLKWIQRILLKVGYGAGSVAG